MFCVENDDRRSSCFIADDNHRFASKLMAVTHFASKTMIVALLLQIKNDDSHML